jgi:protein-disulfide isomerase
MKCPSLVMVFLTIAVLSVMISTKVSAQTVNTPSSGAHNSIQTSTMPTLSVWQYQSLFADAKKTSNPQAKVYMIEYADLECGFCKTMYQQQTLKILTKNYPIIHVVKHFPLSFHPNAHLAAQYVPTSFTD